jgi:hypothetical protein
MDRVLDTSSEVRLLYCSELGNALNGILSQQFSGAMWYTWKMLYSVLLLRVDCLLEAAQYRDVYRNLFKDHKS